MLRGANIFQDLLMMLIVTTSMSKGGDHNTFIDL